MSIFNRKSEVLVTCPRGAAPILADEITQLNFPVKNEHTAAVETFTTMAGCMRLNLHLRTAHRVQFQLASFRARNADDVYKYVREFIEWDEIIAPDGYLSISSFVQNDTIRDTRFANVRVKDAICDYMRDKYDRRPDSGPEQTGTVLFLHWVKNRCKLYLDTSGEPLNRRGYRKLPWKAPMSEPLGAASLLASGWDAESNVVNPMCGSGTLAIEAALIGLNSAPGLMRENFGFMHLPDFDQSRWDRLLDEAESGEKGELAFRIIATDKNPEAVEAAKKNAAAAGVDRYIEFDVCDFRETEVPEGGGIVIMNPEYGERLGDVRFLGDVYQAIGDFFKKKCQGYNGFIFTGNLDLAKQVGLRTFKRLTFFSAKIECKLLGYHLYAGSKKVR
ncbi:MAG: class I SAM-dependent RNA methyltransferase [Desulfovibrionales bacterium]|nr:class I SAM-dependent RNA methyltransferase [Desulfovibrionales bacterium]